MDFQAHLAKIKTRMDAAKEAKKKGERMPQRPFQILVNEIVEHFGMESERGFLYGQATPGWREQILRDRFSFAKSKSLAYPQFKKMFKKKV